MAAWRNHYGMQEVLLPVGAAGRRSMLPRLIAALLMLAAVLSMASVRQADAAEQVPFHGTFTTTGRGALCAPLTICISAEGSGQATHLGRTELRASAVVTITFAPCSDVPNGTIRTFTASSTLTAANGDTITLSGSGVTCGNGMDIVASATYSVTGGTGRFSGASGTISVREVRIGSPSATLTMSGTISSPGAAK